MFNCMRKKVAGRAISACCLFFVLIGIFLAPQVADAAQILQSSNSSMFGNPQINENKALIKINSSGVKYIRHTKYEQSNWKGPTAYKQLRATTSFTAFAYSCPGYYMTRVYSDSAGTNMIGWVRTYVANSDIKNSSCAQLYDDSKTLPPSTQKINVTHPSDTVEEPSKMVSSTAPVSASTPIVRDTSDEDLIEYQAGQVDPATLSAEEACKAKASSTGVAWQLKYKESSKTWECVITSDCFYNSTLWHCSAPTVAQKNAESATTIDNPDRNLYNVTSCSDAASPECMEMFGMGSYSRPNNQVENVYVIKEENPPVDSGGEEEEPTPDPDPEKPTVPSGECPIGAGGGVVADNCDAMVMGCFEDGIKCDPTPSNKTCNAGIADDRDPYSWMDRTEDGQCARFYICYGDSTYVGHEQFCRNTSGVGGDVGTTDPTEPTEPEAPNCDEDIWNEECVPSCYCPKLEKYGAGLGFMCCVWDCPGLDGIVDGFKDFIANDAIGEATAPPVPEFDPPPMPNIFDILNDVEQRKPDPITTTEDPALETSTFTADDVRMEAEEIPTREDPTGGFKITDPLESLPEDGSTAPRPKEEMDTIKYPGGSGNTEHIDGDRVPKPGNGGTSSDSVPYPKSSNNIVKPPEYSDSVKPPSYSDQAEYPTMNGGK